ncbi:MAG: IS200/IS605 family transposase [Planctomycetota bacterium]|nr:IS200/IS605 family transposase [Planctomycetota bacterium]
MPQSLARLYTHLVFSTKHREPTLPDSSREPLHRYLAVVLQDLHCPPILINSVEDHIHLLFDLGRTVAIATAVEKIKTSSSKWMKSDGPQNPDFAWQSGYAAFSVSVSMVDTVHAYIANQAVHHRTQSFQDEYRKLLEHHGVEFDEQYVWD